MVKTFIGGLTPVDAKKVVDAGVSRAYPARSFLSHEGDPSTGVLVVESGLLRIDRTTGSGRVVLLDLATPGDLIGELGVLDGASRSATTATVTESVVRWIPSGAFRSLLRDEQAIQDAVMRRLAERLRGVSTQFVEISVMDAPCRIAARLVRLVEIEQSLGRSQPSHDGVIEVRLPISQEELGQWAGLAREGTVRGLTVLRSINLIETGRMRVRILDMSELRRRAAAN